MNQRVEKNTPHLKEPYQSTHLLTYTSDRHRAKFFTQILSFNPHQHPFHQRGSMTQIRELDSIPRSYTQQSGTDPGLPGFRMPAVIQDTALHTDIS